MGSFSILAPAVDRESSFDEVTAAWERDWLVAQRGFSPNTVAAYTSDVSDFVSYLRAFGLEKFDQVEAADITAWVAVLASRQLSPSTFRARICALKDLYRYLGAYGLADATVLPDIAVPKQEPSKERPLSSEQERAIWTTFDDDTPAHQRDRAEFILMEDMGLRASELVALDVSDIHVADMDVWVSGKGGKHRLLPICDDTLLVVTRYIKLARPRLKCAKLAQDPRALFLNRRGQRITRQAVWKCISAHGRAAGVEGVHPHQLRRTFATTMYRNDVNMRVIQELLGHESLETTNLYLSPDKADLKVRHKRAVVRSWEHAAENDEREASLAPDEQSREYWLAKAKFARERAAFEREPHPDLYEKSATEIVRETSGSRS